MNSFFILFLGFFFFFDHSFDPHIAEHRQKPVNAYIWVDWEAVLHLQEFVERVFVFLGESDVGNSIDYFEMIGGWDEWSEDQFFMVPCCEFLICDVASVSGIEVGASGVLEDESGLFLHRISNKLRGLNIW